MLDTDTKCLAYRQGRHARAGAKRSLFESPCFVLLWFSSPSAYPAFHWAR